MTTTTTTPRTVYVVDIDGVEVERDTPFTETEGSAWDYGLEIRPETQWVTVYTFERTYLDGEVTEETAREVVTVEIPPGLEPACVEDEHDWQRPVELVGGLDENPGVQGHAGGVIIDEACVHCGCRRRTDTWAQNPTTGEQGLTSVRYDEWYYR